MLGTSHVVRVSLGLICMYMPSITVATCIPYWFVVLKKRGLRTTAYKWKNTIVWRKCCISVGYETLREGYLNQVSHT